MAILARYIGKKMKRIKPKKSRKPAKSIDESSSSECSTTASEGSSCEDDFAKEFGKIRIEEDEEKEEETPKSQKELQLAYNKVNCTVLTRYLWKEVEKHEKGTKQFKTTGQMYTWVRQHLLLEIVYK